MPLSPASWDLADIAPKSTESAFRRIKQQVAAFEKERRSLTKDIAPKKFLALAQQLESLVAETARLGVYAELHFAEDSSHQQAQAFRSHVETFLTAMNTRLLFFDLWFKALPEPKAKELIAASGAYAYHFQHLRKFRKYALQENEEKIIQIKDVTGVSALCTVYETLTSQFRYRLGGKELTQEELLRKVRAPSPALRKEAYSLLLSTYKNVRDPLGEIYRSIVIDWREEHLGLRGYKNALEVRNLANDIPAEAVEALLRVCQKNYPIFQRHFAAKKKALGLKRFTRFDLYAPLAAGGRERTISYAQAVDFVLETFGSFSAEFREAASAILAQNHIHSRVQPNKRTGAFCSSVTTKIAPYILLSYTGKLQDLFTLAHELGHGVHDILASQQTELTFQAPLPLAETASTFAEMLLSERLLYLYPEQTKSYLFDKLDDLYATIARQAGFVLFEKKAHELIPQGGTLQELSSLYLADLRKQFGSRIAVDELFAHEWLYISHIFRTPFYCYAYAFGNLLVLSLYEQYRREGKAFVPKVIRFLSRGGSASPLTVTKEVGVDICSEQFWQQGFTLIERMVTEAERLA